MLTASLRALSIQYCRVLELWEDKEGEDAGSKTILVRWHVCRRVHQTPLCEFSHPPEPAHRFFLPKHLTPNCKERTRIRKDLLDVRQVYEQCDAGAHADRNPVASVRRLCRVLCKWDNPKNQLPDIAKVNLATFDWWFDSGWDAIRGKIVPLDKCVDSTGALPWTHARGTLACGNLTSCGPPPDKRYPSLKSSEICHKAPVAQPAAQQKAAPLPPPPPPPTEPRPENPEGTVKRKFASKPSSSKKPRTEPEPPADAGKKGVRAPRPQQRMSLLDDDGGDNDAHAPLPVPAVPPKQQPGGLPLHKAVDVAAAGAEKTAGLAKPVVSKRFTPKIPKRTDASLSPEAALPPVASMQKKAASAAAGGGAAGAGRANARGDTSPTLEQWLQTGRSGQAAPVVLRVDGLPPAISSAEWQAALKAARVAHYSTALNGWKLPDGTWRGNGSAYVLCDRASTPSALAELHGAALKLPGVPGVRPLYCKQLELHSLVPANPPPPLPGHIGLAAADLANARAATRIGPGEIVPHFVHSNTMETTLSTQWRVMSVQHKLATELLDKKQTAELVDVLEKTYA